MLFSINHQSSPLKIAKGVSLTVKNCTFNGVYYHGITCNGKRQLSSWTKKFICKIKYNL